ncbi:MAG TPA: HypC/HybG/HupF family hydrogenase formation chaperone [Caldimonas sp.]|nr:HypC/HybG/HupF family hydrogenase formation chaperone [Caldimonas sp.]
MCIGEPLRVVSIDGCFAWCEAGGTRERLDMRLVGEQPIDTWVLASLGAARQVLSALDAERTRDARAALTAVLQGEGALDAFFADLVDREPSLPAHLQAAP